MTRVILFDLGLTLVDAQQRPFPHVMEALDTIEQFVTAKGQPLVSGLVSDYDMPTRPVTPQKIDAIFARYLVILDQTGLRSRFEPVERRVTLSTHAGAVKPDRRIFVTALKRLQSSATLPEFLFITENADHIEAARTRLHMSALQFRSAGSPHFDFDDWLQAPALVAHLIEPHGGVNTETALRRQLSAAHGFDLHGVDHSEATGSEKVRGTLWKPVGGAAGNAFEDVHVPFSVEGEVVRGPGGDIRSVHFKEPAAGEIDDAAALVRSLARHGQVRGGSPSPLGDVATHDIETDAQGRRKLVRKRFRAI